MKMRSQILAGWVLFCALSLNAQPLFEISPHFGYRWGGDLETESGHGISLEDGRAYGLSFDYSTADNPGIKLEILWSRQESGFDLSTPSSLQSLDMTVDNFQIGGVLETSRGRARAYLTGLIGATLFDPEDSDPEAYFSLSIGGGVKYFLFPNLALRADLRGYCTVVDSESAFISSGGVTLVRFSGSTMWQGEITGGITLAF
jgi:hypothetical protein